MSSSLPIRTIFLKEHDDMKLMIIKFGEEPIEKECDSFEFRCNQVSNWIKIKKGDNVEMIHGIATIKTLE